MTSIEGKRGEPRPRPPFPAREGPVRQAHRSQQRGDLCQHPADHSTTAPSGSAAIGTEKSKGTKVFALGGKITQHRPGGGSHGHHPARRSWRRSAAASRAARSSRPPRPAAPPAAASRPRLIDTPIDYDNLIAIGSMMGSGGLIVMDEDDLHGGYRQVLSWSSLWTSPAASATPCRIGTKRLLEMLDQDHRGQRRAMEDLDKHRGAVPLHQGNPPCAAWGRPPPTRCCPPSRYFRDEYDGPHLREALPGRRVQGAASQYIVDPSQVQGLHPAAPRTARPAPSTGTVRAAPYHRYQPSASSAASCMDKCRFGAIYKQ